MKHIAYLGLGTNLGDRRKNMAEAIERIEKSVGTVLRQSTFMRQSHGATSPITGTLMLWCV